jgi:hypothetical protein
MWAWWLLGRDARTRPLFDFVFIFAFVVIVMVPARPSLVVGRSTARPSRVREPASESLGSRLAFEWARPEI